MRNRLYLAAVLVCILALSTTSWAYDRPYVIHDENVSSGSTGTTLDDHPWGEDQSIANPNTGGTSTVTVGTRPRVSAIAKADQYVLQVRMYFVNMLIRWTHPSTSTTTDSGTTTDVVVIDNSTTVKDGVQ